MRSNTKKAIENIRNYIVEHFDCSNYIGYGITAAPEGFEDIANFILSTFDREATFHHSLKTPREDRFVWWCSGLPSVLDTCYYYNRSAVTDLGNILEQTEDERSKYSESEAEDKLTRLIYRELCKVERM